MAGCFISYSSIYTAFSLLVWEITLKPATVMPVSIISPFIFMVCCSATTGSLLFRLAVHLWENSLFILVPLSHSPQLYSRILQQRVPTCVGQCCAFSLLYSWAAACRILYLKGCVLRHCRKVVKCTELCVQWIFLLNISNINWWVFSVKDFDCFIFWISY